MRSQHPPVLCCVRQPLGTAPCWPWPLCLGAAPASLLRWSSHVPAPASAAARILAFPKKNSISRLTLAVLAGTVFNLAAWLLCPLQSVGAAWGTSPSHSQRPFPSTVHPGVPSPREQGCWLRIPTTQGLCFVLFARSLCENSARSRIEINKNQEDLLHEGHHRSLLQRVLQLQGSTGGAGECQPGVHR